MTISKYIMLFFIDIHRDFWSLLHPKSFNDRIQNMTLYENSFWVFWCGLINEKYKKCNTKQIRRKIDETWNKWHIEWMRQKIDEIWNKWNGEKIRGMARLRCIPQCNKWTNYGYIFNSSTQLFCWCCVYSYHVWRAKITLSLKICFVCLQSLFF